MQVLSVALTLFSLVLQFYQTAALHSGSSHTYAKRVAYLDGCDRYSAMLSDALEDVRAIGYAGWQAIDRLEKYYDSMDLRILAEVQDRAQKEERRIREVLEVLFGAVLTLRVHQNVRALLAVLKGTESHSTFLFTCK